MGQDPLRSLAILQRLGLPATIITLFPPPPRTTACLGIQPPSPHSPARALSLSRSLSDPRCHKPSYILPRVTKLRDAGDKGSSSPGTGTRRITSLAVCLSLIFTPVGSQTVTPQPAMRAVMVFFFFFPHFLPNAVSMAACFSGRCTHTALRLAPRGRPAPPEHLYKRIDDNETETGGGGGRKDPELYIQMPLTQFIFHERR